MNYKIDYKLESGAAKKRKRDAEVAEWQSKNGPVVVTKISDRKINSNE